MSKIEDVITAYETAKMVCQQFSNADDDCLAADEADELLLCVYRELLACPVHSLEEARRKHAAIVNTEFFQCSEPNSKDFNALLASLAA
jgi:hypothetical protein